MNEVNACFMIIPFKGLSVELEAIVSVQAGNSKREC